MGSELRSGTGGYFVLIGDSRDDGDGKVTLLPLSDETDEKPKGADNEPNKPHRTAAKDAS